MVGRLIDADLLKKNCKCTGTFESNFQCVSLKTLGEVIDAQPTAYDPDRVVAQLENYCFEKYCAEGDPEIERIVKGGGVDDKSL